jgi:hypothetical protein
MAALMQALGSKALRRCIGMLGHVEVDRCSVSRDTFPPLLGVRGVHWLRRRILLLSSPLYLHQCRHNAGGAIPVDNQAFD